VFIAVSACSSRLTYLYLNGKDLRTLPLIERKAALKKWLRRKRSRILYLDHVESDGRLLYEQIVEMDLEGIVLQAEGFSIQGDGETFALLDQSEESEVQPVGRARGIVRARVRRSRPLVTKRNLSTRPLKRSAFR
jgi:hypothetical protein